MWFWIQEKRGRSINEDDDYADDIRDNNPITLIISLFSSLFEISQHSENSELSQSPTA